MERGDSTERQWQQLGAVFLPVHMGAKGCRRKSHVPDGLAKTIVQSPPARRRRVGAAYPLVSGTGQALRRTAASRSYKWRKQGPWDRLLAWGNRKLTLPGR